MRGSRALPFLIHAGRRGLLITAFGLLGGCEAPPEAQFPISPEAAAQPAPELAPTTRFARVAEESGTAAEGLGADRDSLAARAAALRATAAGLSGPVIDADSRARLTTAREQGITVPAE